MGGFELGSRSPPITETPLRIAASVFVPFAYDNAQVWHETTSEQSLRGRFREHFTA